MAWFKVDDGFSTSPKVLSIPRSERLAALGLWTVAGTWCAKHLTDGAVPAFMLAEWGADVSHGTALVEAGLWVQTDVGYQFHDWSDYQPSRADVQAFRDKERRRKEEWRAKKAEKTGQSHETVPPGQTGDGTDVSQRLSALPDPTHPDPTRPSTDTTSTSDADASDASRYSDEVKELCEMLAAAVRANGHKVNVVGVKWWAACERLMRLDGYSAEQIAIIIRWSTADEFWSANIRSMPTLREKFSQLKAKRNQQLEKRQSGPRRLTNAEMALAEYQEIYGGDSDEREGNQAALDQGLSA